MQSRRETQRCARLWTGGYSKAEARYARKLASGAREAVGAAMWTIQSFHHEDMLVEFGSMSLTNSRGTSDVKRVCSARNIDYLQEQTKCRQQEPKTFVGVRPNSATGLAV